MKEEFERELRALQAEEKQLRECLAGIRALRCLYSSDSHRAVLGLGVPDGLAVTWMQERALAFDVSPPLVPDAADRIATAPPPLLAPALRRVQQAGRLTRARLGTWSASLLATLLPLWSSLLDAGAVGWRRVRTAVASGSSWLTATLIRLWDWGRERAAGLAALTAALLAAFRRRLAQLGHYLQPALSRVLQIVEAGAAAVRRWDLSLAGRLAFLTPYFDSLRAAWPGRATLARGALVGLLAATVVVPGWLGYRWLTSRPPSVQELVGSGRQYFDEALYPEAVIQLRNALRQDGRHRQALQLLARAYLKQRQPAEAAAVLRNLVNYYPDDTAATLQLGGLYLVAGQRNDLFLKEALQLAREVLGREPQNVAALVLAGNALAGIKDFDSAVAEFQKALLLEPANSSIEVSLGTARALGQDLQGAEQSFLHALEAAPENKSALASLLNFYVSTQDPAKAEEIYERAADLYPAEPSFYLPLAALYFRSGQLDKSDQLLAGVQAVSDTAAPSLVQVAFLSTSRRLPEARQLLEELQRRFPDDRAVARRLAATLIRTDRERAREAIETIRQQDPDDPVGQLLAGELQLFSGQLEQARATLETALEQHDSPRAHTSLARTLAALGQSGKAERHYRKALEQAPDYLAALGGLAELQLQQGHLEAARQPLGQLLAARPDDYDGLLLGARLDLEEGKVEAAYQTLQRLYKVEPDEARLQHLLGIYYTKRRQYGVAEMRFNRALELEPGSARLLSDLVRFYLTRRQPDRAVAVIEENGGDHPGILHYRLLARAEQAGGHNDRAEAALRKAAQLDPGPTSALQLARLYHGAGRPADALAVLDRVIRQHESADALTMRGKIRHGRGNLRAAEADYRRCLHLEACGAEVANNLAYILAQRGTDLLQARAWASEAVKAEPENADFHDTLGWLYFQTENFQFALQHLRIAARGKPADISIRYHLALALSKNDHLQEAAELLQQLLREHDTFSERTAAVEALKQVQDEMSARPLLVSRDAGKS